jgi:Flp pilus assembly protein TadG
MATLISRPSRRARRGANAVEFALTLPVAVAVLAGIIDYGWIFFQQEAIQNATRDGVRFASVSTPLEDHISRAIRATEDALQRSGIDPATAKIDAYYEGVFPDERITVVTRVPFSPLFGIVPVPVNLGAQLSMRVESQENLFP